MPVNSEQRLEYFRNYHKERRKEDPELYKQRCRNYAATFRNKQKQEKNEKLKITDPQD
jgi:hypothetical protein